ncbi:MAG: PQQ-like beta-propeller repeat protein [Spirochaetes bacterium]|nr:PQQ-like beta-propeller repeat protein [Spirochaetota bacterium]MBN2771594.1 PQQ-like beta-propeller repeat protein [Spirochaetota bacterium]
MTGFELLGTKCIKKSKIIYLTFLTLMITILISCGGGSSDDKKTESEDPTPTTTSEIDEDLMAYGVPAVDANDNTYMLFKEDLMMSGPTNAVSFNNDGSLNWNVEIDDYLQDIVICNDLIILSGLNKVYAVNNSDGSTEWSYEITDESGLANTKGVHKPCIDSDGNIVIAVDSYLLDISTAKAACLISIKPDGTLNNKTEFSTGDDYYDRFIKMSPVMATDSGIFFSVFKSTDTGDSVSLYRYDNNLNALNNRLYTGDVASESSFLAVTDTYVLFGLQDNNTYKSNIISMNNIFGSDNWTIFLDDYVINSPVIDKDNNIYIGCEDGYIYKLNSTDGSEIWSSNIGEIFIQGELIIGKNQKIYKSGQLPTEINMTSGTESSSLSDKVAGSDGAMLSDGTLVYGSDNKLIRVSTSSGGICLDAKWAKYGKDAANSSFY